MKIVCYVLLVYDLFVYQMKTHLRALIMMRKMQHPREDTEHKIDMPRLRGQLKCT